MSKEIIQQAGRALECALANTPAKNAHLMDEAREDLALVIEKAQQAIGCGACESCQCRTNAKPMKNNGSFQPTP